MGRDEFFVFFLLILFLFLFLFCGFYSLSYFANRFVISVKLKTTSIFSFSLAKFKEDSINSTNYLKMDKK